MPRKLPVPQVEDRSWFEFVAAKGDDPAEILIYDYIGSYGVTAASFDAGLKALGPQSDVTMRINSPGGETPTAASIYNMLERYLAKNSTTLTVIIDGVAASAASWIAMLGDDVVMPENTLMMIHDPAGFAMGTSREMRSLAAVLDRIKQGMVSAYVKKSGQSKEEVEAIMEAETWYSADEAVAAGFADRVDNPIEIAASFDMSRFIHPPEELRVPHARNGASTKEGNMPKQETAAEMEARLRTEITASVAAEATKTTVVVPPVVTASETAEQMQSRIRNEVNATVAEVNSLCVIAGHPELAAGFVASGKSVADVRKELETAAKASPAPGALNTHANVQHQGLVSDKGLVASTIDTSKVWDNYRHGKGTAVSYDA